MYTNVFGLKSGGRLSHENCKEVYMLMRTTIVVSYSRQGLAEYKSTADTLFAHEFKQKYWYLVKKQP